MPSTLPHPERCGNAGERKTAPLHARPPAPPLPEIRGRPVPRAPALATARRLAHAHFNLVGFGVFAFGQDDGEDPVLEGGPDLVRLHGNRQG